MVDHFDKIDKETIGMLRNAHMKQVQLDSFSGPESKHVDGHYSGRPQRNRLKYGDK